MYVKSSRVITDRIDTDTDVDVNFGIDFFKNLHPVQRHRFQSQLYGTVELDASRAVFGISCSGVT